MGFLISKISSKIKEWHSWEDEHSVKAMRDIYRGFHRVGFVIIDLSSKYAAFSIFSMILGGLTLLTISLGLIYSCYLMREDFEVSSGNCNLGFLSTLALAFMCNHTYYRRLTELIESVKLLLSPDEGVKYIESSAVVESFSVTPAPNISTQFIRQFFKYEFQRKIIRLHRMIGVGFHEYNEPQYDPEEVDKWRHQIGKVKKGLIALACYVVLIAILVVVVCPIIDESLGFGWDVPYDEFGVNRQMPVPIWLPFNSHEGFGHWFTYLILEGYGGAMITLSIGGTALLFTGLCGGLLMEQKLLALSIRSLEKRARRLYKLRRSGMKTSIEQTENKKKKLADNPLYQECIGDCLKENVKHHHAVLEYTRLYLTIARCPFLTAFFVETAAIAMSMVKLNEGSSKWGANIAFGCIAIAEVANMAMLCTLGELVTSVSTEVNEELYNIKWNRFDKKNRMILLQFLVQTKNPIKLTALGLVVCSMEQFSQVMNTAYSFFNLLKVTKTREGG